MICMGVDSSGKTASVAVMQDQKLLFEEFANTGLTHSQTLLPMMAHALERTGLTPAQVELYAVSAGPGSFTGLRIGLAAVKGMAQPFATPCAGVSTLEALAWNVTAEGTVICALDARRGEVYWAAFDGLTHTRLLPDTASPLDQMDNFLGNCKKPVFFVGDGAVLCYNRYDHFSEIIRLPQPEVFPRGAGLCLAGMEMHRQGLSVSPTLLVPQYHRLSQAERERAARCGLGKTEP